MTQAMIFSRCAGVQSDAILAGALAAFFLRYAPMVIGIRRVNRLGIEIKSRARLGMAKQAYRQRTGNSVPLSVPSKLRLTRISACLGGPRRSLS